MLGRFLRLPLVGLLALTACSGPAPRPAPAASTPAPAATSLVPPKTRAGARLFQNSIDDAFWVSHEPDRDRLITGGVRFELSPSAEVLAEAWEIELARTGDPLLGALAIAPHLGGGYLHWNRTRLFRSDTFTGPLRPVATAGALGDGNIRGARNGTRSVVIFSEAATAELLPGSDRLTRPTEAGLIDLAALDARRAVRLDALGRTATTSDGGATWIDATAATGLSSKNLVVEPSVIGVETWRGRFELGAEGRLGPLDGNTRGNNSGARAFQPLLRGSRVDDRDAWWIWRETPAVQSAVFGGALLAPGHALALAQSAAADVDLNTGELSRAITDWPTPSLLCSAAPARDGALVVCGWEVYQGYGAYVLSTRNGLPPQVEHAFSDEGYFVADDDGALAFVGSCSAKARVFDPNDPTRQDMGTDIKPAPTICVRRGPGDWVERTVSLEPGTELYGWAARTDGTAVALVVDPRTEGLPALKQGPEAVVERDGVRVVRVPAEMGGWMITRPSWSPYGNYMGMRGPLGPLVDRRFHARADGSIEGWLAPPGVPDAGAMVRAAVRIDASGSFTVLPPPPRAAAMITTGDFGVAVSTTGELFETLDHGHSWQAAGPSPLPPSMLSGACSALGCAFGSMTRLGWGAPRVVPAVRTEDLPALPADPPAPVRLACTETGMPEPLAGEAASPSDKRPLASWPTGWGDTIELTREGPEPQGEEPQGPHESDPKPPVPLLLGGTPQPTATPSATPSAAPKAPPARRAPALRTHTLLYRPPFDPDAGTLRLDATSASFEEARRATITPLLGADGEARLFFVGERSEVIIGPERITTLPLYEQHRYSSMESAPLAGLLIAPDRALLMGELRRRVTIEDHGPEPLRSPLILGPDRDAMNHRAMVLARRDDGTMGLILWDGTPPSAVAVALLDVKSSFVGERMPLAPWSTAVPADDPRCKKDERAFHALVPVTPSAWLALAPGSLAGVELGSEGAALVRWGASRVCVEAVDLGVIDRRADNNGSSAANLVARWESGKGKKPGATIRSSERKQALRCRLESAAEGAR
jgi:hypothetical protein